MTTMTTTTTTTTMDKNAIRDIIAKNIAERLATGSVVNLGLGIPTRVASFVKPEQQIILQAENGLLGTAGDTLPGEECDPDVISSSGYPTRVIPGAAFFDSAVAFGIIRGGHVDVTVLGTMEVDELGNIANYEIPGKLVTGMGGAMDLCQGAKQVIVATSHTNNGRPKILKRCTIPLTAKGAVDMIVTEKAIIKVTPAGFSLIAVNPMFSLENIINEVDAPLQVPEKPDEMSGL